MGKQIYFTGSDDFPAKHEECNTCPSGTEWDSIATACKFCGAGKRNVIDPVDADSWDSKCEDCPAARHSTADNVPANHVECLQCPKGYFYESNTECKDCPSGYQQSIDVAAAGQDLVPRVCKRCGLGKVATSTYLHCAGCSVGRYQDVDEADMTWTFTINAASPTESQGVAVTQAATGGAVSGTLTTALTGASVTTVTVTSAIGQTFDASANLVIGTSGTIINAADVTNAAGDLKVQVCKECVNGQYAEQDTQVACKKCPHGKYNSGSGYSEHDNEVDCKDCDTGKFSLQGAEECSKCAPGKAPGTKAGTDVQICIECVPGKYNSEEGADVCTKCAVGQFSEHYGQIICYPCSVGEYQPETNTINCLECPVGWSQNNRGAIECTACAAGLSTISKRAKSCEECVPGKFSASNGAICTSCSKGTFSDTARNSICKDCPKGKWSDTDGRETCTNCAVGK